MDAFPSQRSRQRLVDLATAAALALDPVALSDGMIEALRRAHAYAPARSPVVLVGETGTGKTTLARCIHAWSGRPDGFHAFSVGSLTPQLVQDKLFGHVPGAFTDAKGTREGAIRTAGRGTFLLDDFQNLDAECQKQVLQLLGDGTGEPVGSDRAIHAGCRFIFAMAQPPDVLMQRGVLTPDVRYRLRRLEIRLPPLHERRAEIPIYVKRFLAACRDWTGLDGPREVAANALTVFRLSDYPGNLRDLASFVELAYVEAGAQGGERIEVRHLPSELRRPMRFVPHGDREANRSALEHALAICGGRVSEAARLIGASRSRAYELLTQQTARVSGMSGTPAITGRRGASRTFR